MLKFIENLQAVFGDVTRERNLCIMRSFYSFCTETHKEM